MLQHPRFDLARAIQQFPPAEVRERERDRDRERGPRINPFTKEPIPGPAPLRPGGEIITSPYDLAIVEQIRDDVFAGSRPEHALAVDVFVFGLGPPPQPYLTAIGGLPVSVAKQALAHEQGGTEALACSSARA